MFPCTQITQLLSTPFFPSCCYRALGRASISILLSLLYTVVVTAQTPEWITEPVYGHYAVLKEGLQSPDYALWEPGQPLLIVDKNRGIVDLGIVDSISTVSDMVTVAINRRYYYVDEEYALHPLNFPARDTTVAIKSVKVVALTDEYVFYELNEKELYVQHRASGHSKNLLTTSQSARFGPINNSRAYYTHNYPRWVKNESGKGHIERTSDHFLYHMERDTAFLVDGLPYNGSEYYAAQSHPDSVRKLRVLDNLGNVVVGYDEGYNMYVPDGDLVALCHDSLGCRAFYRDKELPRPFPYNRIEVASDLGDGYLFATQEEHPTKFSISLKTGLITGKGEVIAERDHYPAYMKTVSDSVEYIVLHGSGTTVFVRNGRVFRKWPSGGAQVLYDNRFRVYDSTGWASALVDSNANVVNAYVPVSSLQGLKVANRRYLISKDFNYPFENIRLFDYDGNYLDTHGYYEHQTMMLGEVKSDCPPVAKVGALLDSPKYIVDNRDRYHPRLIDWNDNHVGPEYEYLVPLPDLSLVLAKVKGGKWGIIRTR